MGSILIILTACAASLVFCGCRPNGPPPEKPAGKSHDHGNQHGHANDAGGSALMVHAEPADFQAGEPVALTLMIHRPDGSMVNDFETVHEKKVHLIIVREGLDEFAHIHPELDNTGNMRATFSFPVGGRYLLYADHKPSGGRQATAVAEVNVPGDAPTPRKLSPNVPGTVKGGNITAKVSVDNARSGGETKIAFSLADSEGKPVTDLQPYLGAMGHLVVISADGKRYVHAHPLNADRTTPSVVEFEAHFTASGLYKGWGQFRRQDKVDTVPFVIRVD